MTSCDPQSGRGEMLYCCPGPGDVARTTGHGTRTWEYSPEYGLRSFLYLNIFATPGKFLVGLFADKAALFSIMRLMIALGSIEVEQRLVKAVVKKFNNEVGLYLVLIFCFCSGLAHASISFLPQTFAMLMISLSFSEWLQDNHMWAILHMGIAGLVGWPFAVIMGIPMGCHILYIHKNEIWKPLACGVGTIAVTVIPSLAVDYHYYGKFVWSIGNIAMYNAVPTSADGSQLYGTEPWTYYVMNLFLNFNGMLFLALIPIGLLYLAYSAETESLEWSYFGPSKVKQLALYLSGAVIWLVCMFAMPHKEERFLYVAYPSLCLSAAYSVAAIRQYLDGGDEISRDSKEKPFAKFKFTAFTKKVVFGIFGCFAIVSLSRTWSLYTNYGGATKTFSYLSRYGWRHSPEQPEIKVCVGKEWHRFPSHFYLPEHQGQVHRLEFLQTEFDGILPKHYDQEKTWDVPSDMNNQNKQEMSRYVQPEVCDWIVDLDLPDQKEPHFYNVTKKNETHTITWKRHYSAPFLDAAATPSLARAFYIPFYSSWMSEFRRYVLLKKVADPIKKAWGKTEDPEKKKNKKKKKGGKNAEEKKEKEEKTKAEAEKEPSTKPVETEKEPADTKAKPEDK